MKSREKVSPQAALELKINSQQFCEFVGNGLERSVIGEFTAISIKTRIDYNILLLEPEQASQFPTTSFQNSSSLSTLHISTLHSSLSALRLRRNHLAL